MLKNNAKLEFAFDLLAKKKQCNLNPIIDLLTSFMEKWCY